MRGIGFYPSLPDQRAKKKNLNASEFLALLKIDGFTGKFGNPAQVPAGSTGGSVHKVRDAAVTAVGTGKGRPDSSFKIKDSMRQVSEVQSVDKPKAADTGSVQIQFRDAFDRDGVKEAVRVFVDVCRPDSTVMLALTTHLPLVEGEKIIFLADNQLQIDRLMSLRIQIQNSIRKTLNNGFISVGFRLFDTESTGEERKFFTSGEKFEHFVKLNPVVAELKDIFGLEFD